MDWQTVISVIDGTLRLTTPLLLACLAGLYCERAGIFNIGLEGKMLVGAFAAAVVAALTGSAWLGLGAAIIAGMAFAAIHAVASITLKGNQIISGVAINFLASGLTTLLGQSWFGQGGRTPPLLDSGRFQKVFVSDIQPDWNFGIDLTFPSPYNWLEWIPEAVLWVLDLVWSGIAFVLYWMLYGISLIPGVGTLLTGALVVHPVLTYIAFAMVPITAWVLYRTRFGLRLRAVGENPKAVDTAGISVTWLRYQSVIIAGILCGIAGAYLSIALGSGFGRDMTGGRGFIALAALIFAKWRPLPAMLACLLFGFLDSLQIRLQSTELPMIGKVPVQLIQALPYILTVILLAGFIGKAIGPKAGGVPYTKER